MHQKSPLAVAPRPFPQVYKSACAIKCHKTVVARTCKGPASKCKCGKA